VGSQRLARFYSFTSSLPQAVMIPTAHFLDPALGIVSLPMVEAALGSRLFIHDCLVEVHDSKQRSQFFRIYLTRHALQPHNCAIKRIDPLADWPGQMVVMKVAKRNKGILINVGRCDRRLADRAVLRCV
jgi:hypothetical protein